MILKEFQVSGFRSLLSPGGAIFKGITVFAGENDGGKTAFVDALELFLTNKVPDNDDFTSYPDVEIDIDEISLEGVFELSENEIEIARNIIPAITNNMIRIKRSLRKGQTLEPHKIRTFVYSDQRFNVNFNRLTVPQLKELAVIAGISYKSGVLKQELVDSLVSWRASQQLEEGEMELPQELVLRLPVLETFVSSQALDPEERINRVLRSTFKEEIESGKYSGKIDEITQDISAELRKDIDVLEPFIKTYCPEIEEINIEPKFDFQSGFTASRLQLKRIGGVPFALEKGGQGQRRRVTLAIYEWNLKLKESRQDENARQIILAFDEPDTHFDYKYQRKILEILSKLSDLPNTQVLIITHSLNLIDRVDISCINHFYLENQRETKIEMLAVDDPETIDLFMYNLSENLGLKNCIMLNERCFLILEGHTEYNALPILFKKKYGKNIQEAGIRLLNGEGNIGALKFAQFLKNNRRRVIFMLDADAITTGSNKRKFTEESLRNSGFNVVNEIFFVGAKKFEDVFSDELWARTANKEWPKSDGSMWTESDFAPLRSATKFSTAIKDRIEGDSGQLIEKSDLCRVAMSIDENEIPHQIVTCFESARQLAE